MNDNDVNRKRRIDENSLQIENKKRKLDVEDNYSNSDFSNKGVSLFLTYLTHNQYYTIIAIDIITRCTLTNFNQETLQLIERTNFC